jgi:hypothetical protein
MSIFRMWRYLGLKKDAFFEVLSGLRIYMFGGVRYDDFLQSLIRIWTDVYGCRQARYSIFCICPGMSGNGAGF